MDKFKPMVSIVIPVYNGANYLADAIKCALAQNYKNLEVVVVNDGSKDGGQTAAIAQSFGSKIRYFEKINGGVASALNVAIKNAKGEYISWLSHDDLYTSDKVSAQVKRLIEVDSNKRASTIVYSDYKLMSEKGKVFAEVKLSSSHKIERLNVSLYPLINGLIHGCTLLIPKRAFDEYGYFDEGLRHTQDYDLWLKFLKKMDICYTPKALVLSRVHDMQDSKRNDAKTVRDFEVNALWIKIYGSVTPAERMKLAENDRAFYRRALLFLETAKFTEPYNFVLNSWMSSVDQTLVSIVLPFFNRIDLTLEAIKSALNQTYRNIEVILVDDGSTDDLDRIRTLLAAEPRLVYKRQENKGPGAARNLGVSVARGEYICFLDSDDRFLPFKVEKQLAFMQVAGVKFTHTSYIRINASGERIRAMESGKHSYKFPSIYSNCEIASPTVMVRKDVIASHLFEESVRLGEDVMTWAEIAKTIELVGIDTPMSEVRILNTAAAIHPEKLKLGEQNIQLAAREGHFGYWLYIKGRNMAAIAPTRLIFLVAAPIYRALPERVKLWLRRSKLTRFCSDCGQLRSQCVCAH